jgi:hypothetical protein
MTTILIKKKDTAGAPAPGDLTNAAGGAEIAVNTSTKRLYTKDSGGNIVEVGTNPSTIDTTTVDTTNLEVTNIKAKDGTASITLANSTGVASFLANPILSAGTVNGVSYLNASKVLTTGSALAFDGTNFLVGGATALANSSLVANQGVVARTAAASGITPYLQLYNGNAGTDLKTWRVGGGAAGALTIETVNDAYSSSIVRMTIDSSGNVGVGTTPSAWASGNRFIDVNASASFGAFGSTDSMALANAFWNGSNWIRKNANNAWRMVMESANASPSLTFQYAGNSTAGSTISWSEAMRIDSSGRVGIGTSSPTNTLDVLGTIGAVNVSSSPGTNYVKVQVNNTGGSFQFGIDNSAGSNFGLAAYGRILWNDGAYPTIFTTNAIERMRITATGNVAIGASFTAAYQLQVFGTGQDTANITDAGSKGGTLYLQATGASSGSGGAVLFGTSFGNQTPFAAIKGLVTDGGQNTVGDLAFSVRSAITDTSLTERMRISQGGNVGIGTSTTTNGNLTIQKSSATTDGPILTLWNSNNSGGNTCGYLRFFSNTSVRAQIHSVVDAGAPFFGNLIFSTGESALTERARINSGGGISVGTTVASPVGGITVNPAAGSAALDSSPAQITLAVSGTQTFPNASGMLLVTSRTTGITNLYICGGAQAVLVSNGAGASIGTFTYNGTSYVFTNTTLVSQTYNFMFFRSRDAS